LEGGTYFTLAVRNVPKINLKFALQRFENLKSIGSGENVMEFIYVVRNGRFINTLKRLHISKEKS
jgi:hypothetical protein